MLHARVAGYQPSWCDELYGRREIVAVTNKALSFVPACEFPWYRHSWGRKGLRFHTTALAENAAVAQTVLARIRAEGPLSSADFERQPAPTKNWFGLPENAVRAVLEAYTVTGALGLARREGFEYVWEGYFPAAKRRFGYYVLPILFGDRLVGRIEPRIEEGLVRILGVRWEEGFVPERTPGFPEAMDEALRAYVRFAGAHRLEWADHREAEFSGR